MHDTTAQILAVALAISVLVLLGTVFATYRPRPRSRRDAYARQVPLMPLALALGAGLVIVGSIGPWVRAGIFSVGGMEGDGVLSLGCGCVALLFCLFAAVRPNPWLLLPALLAFLGAGGVGLYDWINVADSEAPNGLRLTAEVGWGLALMTVASGASAVLTLGTIFVDATTWAPDEGEYGDAWNR